MGAGDLPYNLDDAGGGLHRSRDRGECAVSATEVRRVANRAWVARPGFGHQITAADDALVQGIRWRVRDALERALLVAGGLPLRSNRHARAPADPGAWHVRREGSEFPNSARTRPHASGPRQGRQL